MSLIDIIMSPDCKHGKQKCRLPAIPFATAMPGPLNYQLNQYNHCEIRRLRGLPFLQSETGPGKNPTWMKFLDSKATQMWLPTGAAHSSKNC
jgi:hypothetical protein